MYVHRLNEADIKPKVSPSKILYQIIRKNATIFDNIRYVSMHKVCTDLSGRFYGNGTFLINRE